jgi:hypothetical protein
MPAAWSSALAAATVTVPGVQWFATEAVDSVGDTAYGSYDVNDVYGVGAVSLKRGGLQVISKVSGKAWGGVLWMSVSTPWLAWAESVPGTPGAWDLKVWNMQTRKIQTIASSRLLAGQYTFPVVDQHFVAWSQATSDTSADIRVFDLAHRATKTLASGRLSPPVFAGGYLFWGEYVGNDNQPRFRAVDAATLQPATVADQLAGPTPIMYLAGSGRYLLWTENGSQMAAYNFDSKTTSSYQFAEHDGRHNLQFPMLAGRILVWWSGVTETIVDLDTGKGFDVVNGAAADGGDLLVVSGARGNLPTLSALRLTSTLGISTCS